MTMTWEYVAGFFDGEGCVWIQKHHITRKKRRNPTVSIAQSIDGVMALVQIKEFIELHGIPCSLYESKYLNSPSHTKRYFTLRIHRREAVEAFLLYVQPYSIVKQPVIRKGINWLNTNPRQSLLRACPEIGISCQVNNRRKPRFA